jgi:hypothetical protein
MAEDFWTRALRREARSIDEHNDDDVPELGTDPTSMDNLLSLRNALLRKARSKVPGLSIVAYEVTGDEAADRLVLSGEIAELNDFVMRALPGLSADAVDETSDEYLLH